MKLHAMALVALVPACTSTPTYHTMLEEVRRADLGRDSTDDDRSLDQAELDRAAFVRTVLARNPSLAAARAAWRGALAHVRGAGALEDPTVSFSIAPLSIGSSVPFGWEGSISQRFPWPEKLTLDVAVARAEADAARADYAAARLDLALTATLLYDAYFVAVRSLEVNGAHRQLVSELRELANAHVASGQASAQDALDAEMEVAHIDHDAIMLATDRDVAVAQMNELLHRAPERPLPAPPRELRPQARTEGASDRPEIEAAKRRALAGAERADRARREWFPNLTVMTSYNSMWTTPEHRWMVGVSLDVPIQPGWRAGAELAAEADRERWEAEVSLWTDKARTEVVIAARRRDEAEHVVELYETRLVRIARDEVEVARAGFIASKNDIAKVLAAERNLRSVELGAAVAHANLDKRAAELARARGVTP